MGKGLWSETLWIVEQKRGKYSQYIHDEPVPLREHKEDRVDFARCSFYKREHDRGDVKRGAK